MKRFLIDIVAPLRAGGSGRAERAAHWTLAAAIVFPIAVFVGASFIGLRQAETEANDRLQRNLAIVYEHGVKVLDTIDLTSRYLEEVFEEVTDDQIRANEANFNRRLKSLTDTLPQFADIWVIDANGHPLVSGTVFPIPGQMDLSDREYFKVHKNKEVDGLFVGEPTTARATNDRGQPRFFPISRKRTARDGSFAGVIVLSISPDYFEDYYATLPQPLVAAVIRADGPVLVRYPRIVDGPNRLARNNTFQQALNSGQELGTIRVKSTLDSKERIFSFHKLPRLPAYISAGIDVDSIRATWIEGMARHMIFGVPATIAVIALSFVALARTRREAATNQMLREEISRREATEEALRQSQKMEAVGRLTGGIAHDFNNLLTAIIGNLDLSLRRIEQTERLRGWLSNGRQAADRAATLVQRLLAFSRQHPLEVKSVDVNRLVQGMSELLGRSIGETVTIETVLAGGLWKAAIDPNQLENAIVNLAVNARDAMANGGSLTIETANAHLDEHYVEQTGAQVPAGQYVMVAVSDSGSGMTAEVLNRAFEPFFTTKPTGVGTGLGLSQVYGFVKQSGGHIRIYSEVGEGTTVKMYFPRLTGSDIPMWTPRDTASTAPAVAPDATETVLVVEDDVQVNTLAVEVLRERGYRVLSAPEGASALKMLAEAPHIDLLLTDVVLPGGMNGRQLSEEVLRQRPAIKVLYMTGYTRNAIIHHGRLDPDIDLLTKPFTADALTKKVRGVLDAGTRASK